MKKHAWICEQPCAVPECVFGGGKPVILAGLEVSLCLGHNIELANTGLAAFEVRNQVNLAARAIALDEQYRQTQPVRELPHEDEAA